MITYFYFVIIYREYHKNDLHAITSRLRGHLPILGKDPNLNIGGRGQNNEFYFRLEIDLHSYFHAICTTLEDFEIIDNFDHILPHF